MKRTTLLLLIGTLLVTLALTACVRPAPGSVPPPTFTPAVPGLNATVLPPLDANPTLDSAPTLDPNATLPGATPESAAGGSDEAQPPAEEPAPEAPAPEQEAPSTGEVIHVVQPGESLYRIGLQYGFTYQELADYNGITNPDRLDVGQEIRIPPRP